MHKLIAGFILAIALPMLCMADAPDIPQGSSVPPPDPESLKAAEKAAGEPAETQGGAYEICLRAIGLFEQQEKDKRHGEDAPLAPLSSSCKTELKPAKYWACMEKEAIAKVDFNSAHWRCAKKLNRN